MSFSASIRRSACLLACTLAMASAAFGQELPIEKVTGSELRQGLIWTGHFELWDGDPAEALLKASKSWQAAKGYEQTGKLSEDQANELMAEAVKHRNAVGWSILQDKAVGLSVGVPTKLAKLASARTMNGGTIYDFDGRIGYVLGIRYGDFTCSNFRSYYAFVRRQWFGNTAWRAMNYDTFALFQKKNGEQTYFQATCRTSGVAYASINLTDTQAKSYGELFGALADSLTVGRNFNPTAVPKPKVEDNDDGDGDDLPTDVVASSASKPKKLPPNVDGEGKTARIELQPRDGDDLTTREVFDKVSGAVYVVKAQHKMGSGVAISDRELLTNCHVVDESPNVTIGRDKKEQGATVVSMNIAADRCVLRAENKLPSWVKVRPYDDIKVGERAITLGTPQGLELTVAEGLVSSKRTHKGSKLVQTSAPISHGSSGGGLFDARGELLGITTFYFAGGQNLNFAVAAEEFAKK